MCVFRLCVDGDRVRLMIHTHFMRIRAQPCFARSHIRLFIEANLSFISAFDVVASLQDFNQYGSIEAVRFDPMGKNRFGIWTTAESKELYCREMQRSIEQLHLYRHFARVAQDAERTLPELYSQLGEFRIEIRVPNEEQPGTLFYKRVFTGKGPGKKDDMFMALGIALKYAFDSQSDHRFQQYCAMKNMVSC